MIPLFAFTNVVTNVSWIPIDREVCGIELMENGAWLVVQTRGIDKAFSMQISYAWSSGVGVICRDAFNSKEGLLLDRHRRLIGCDKNVACLQKPLPSLLEV